MTMKPTFEVDKQGLAKLLARKGKHFAVAELIQNAWDENVSKVTVKLTRVSDTDLAVANAREGTPKLDGPLYKLVVIDDNPEGFADLSHAYTLFAESAKKDDPEKRGRFNLGEKLVIAVCEEAIIKTTKGTVRFSPAGRSSTEATKTEAGSEFVGLIKLTEDEAAEVERIVHTLIPPKGVSTIFNGTELVWRTALATFEVTLRTERADEEGFLRPTKRKATVSVYEPLEGEIGTLYELGIPVVESDDTFHVDIGQKVPLNTDRDNVPPGFLRDVRAAVLNAVHEELDEDTATEDWVDDALSDKAVRPAAVNSVVAKRYGEQVVTADPSDREAEKIAVSAGYTVIPAGAFSKAAWANVKGAQAALPAGQVTPSPKPDAGDDTLNLMEQAHWPDNVKRFALYCEAIASEVLGVSELTVRIAHPKSRSDWPFNASWKRIGPKRAELTLNFTALGYGFFEKALGESLGKNPVVSERAHELLIHEFAHHYAGEHLSREFYDACCKVGAKLAKVLAKNPSLLYGVEQTFQRLESAVPA